MFPRDYFPGDYFEESYFGPVDEEEAATDEGRRRRGGLPFGAAQVIGPVMLQSHPPRSDDSLALLLLMD